MKEYNNLSEVWFHTKTLIKNEYGSINNFCKVTKIGTPQKFNPYNTLKREPKLRTLNKILKPFGKKLVIRMADVKPHQKNQNLNSDS